MKKLILFFSMIIAYITGSAQGVWVSQATGFQPVSSGVRNIAVVDTSVVWIAPYDGGGGGFPRQDYSKTLDGGTTWTAGTTPAPAIWDYAMIEGSSATSAWAVFYNASLSPAGQGLVYHTIDGGTTWTQQGANVIYSYPGQSFPNVIHFFDDLNGVIVGDPANNEFEIYTTTDGGTTWTEVPGADIPDALTDEAGWTTHISTFGDNIWFDTNNGRVYHSADKGFHWTVAESNLFIPIPGTIDICFTSATNGIARYYDDALLSSDIVETTDGGATWSSTFNPVGSFLGAAVEAVPGVTNMMVSTGVSNASGFTGSSYTTDGGHNWTTIDAGTQRNALGIADSLTMWSGGFTTDPSTGGIFKFTIFDEVACSDPSVTAGTATASSPFVAGNDTLTVTATGVVTPVIGSYSGVSWIITTTDISGSLDPFSANVVATYRVTFPAAANDSREFVNDLTLIEGLNYPFGIYYWTPIVYGNATAQTVPVQFLTDLTLDLTCIHVGNSVMVNVCDPAAPVCDDRVGEINGDLLSTKAFIRDQSTLNLTINSASKGKALIQITDPAGRIVKSITTLVTAGDNSETINVEDLASGTYILRTDVNGYRSSTKIIK